MRQANGVEIDRCPGCKGYWFNGSELAKAAGVVVPKIEATGTSERRCPLCSIALSTATIEQVHIDYCAKCRGVWLDAGEFKTIQASSKPAPEPQPKRKAERASAGNMTLTLLFGGPLLMLIKALIKKK